MWVFHTLNLWQRDIQELHSILTICGVCSLHSVRIQFQKTATLQTPTVSPRRQPYFDLTIYKLSGSHKGLFRFDNLLEWLTALRKHLCLPFYYKGLNSATNLRVHRARYRGSTLVCPPIQKLSESQSRVFIHVNPTSLFLSWRSMDQDFMLCTFNIVKYLWNSLNIKFLLVSFLFFFFFCWYHFWDTVIHFVTITFLIYIHKFNLISFSGYIVLQRMDCPTFMASSFFSISGPL